MKNEKNLYFISLGCSRNTVDTEILIGNLLGTNKYSLTFEIELADIVIINTCGFLDSAVEESYGVMQEMIALKQKKKIEKIIVTGCLVERLRKQIEYQDEIDLFRGIDHYDKPALFLDRKNKFLLGNKDNVYVNGKRAILGGHYEYVKISEGCTHKCRFCIIPYLKGKLRSRSIPDIITECVRLKESGVKELIVIAQNTSDYGKDIDGRSHLLELLDEIDRIGFRWVRIHYLYPDILDENFVESIFNMTSVIPYFDIPLQHVSPKILTLMGRSPDLEGTFRAIKLIKECGGVIRTSMICGFPSEDDIDFKMVKDILKKYSIERCIFFPFEDVNNIASSLSLNPVPAEVIAERMNEYLDIATDNIYRSFPSGQKETVIVDGNFNGKYFGRTFRDSPEVDTKIILKGKGIKIGEFHKAKLYIADGEFRGDI